MLAAIAVASGMIGWAVVSAPSPRGGPSPEAVRSGSERPTFGMNLDHPLIAGNEVSLEQASDCAGCPSIGEVSSHVKGAYADDAAGVGHVLDDGTWIVMTPDPRSSEEYVADLVPIVESDDFLYEFVEIGAQPAVAADVTELGPAAAMWVQDGYLVEILGKGGATLDDLIAYAKEIVPQGS